MKNKKPYIIPILLLALLLAYGYNDVITSAQAGFRGADRGIVYVLLGVIISMMAGYNFVRGRRKATTSIPLTLWIILLWIIVVNIINASSLWISIIHISLALWWIISYYFTYNYIGNNIDSKNTFINITLVMFLFYSLANLFIRENISETFDRENAVTGYSYLLIIFLPFISLMKNKVFKVFLWGIALILTITSYKRGPIIIIPMMFLVYYFSIAKTNKKWGPFIRRIVFFIFLVAIIVVGTDRLSDGFLSSRFSPEELSTGSGRSLMWLLALSSITQRSFFDFIFGTGSGSSLELLGTSAHNEWIEFLFSFGFIGILLYTVFCIVLIRRYLKLLKLNSRYSPQYGMMIVYVLMVGLFGGLYFLHSTFYIFSFLGLIEILHDKELKSKQITL